MKSKKTDLRVIKTKANIKRVFLDLLKKKPPEKITVTEIAEIALINKGTFYLHYQDVYALYEETIHDTIIEFCESIDFYEDFFECPKAFVRKFIQLVVSGNNLEKTFPHIKPADTKVPVPHIMMEEMKRRIYALDILKQTISNDIKLDCILLDLFPVSFRYGKENVDETVAVVSHIIELLFKKE